MSEVTGGGGEFTDAQRAEFRELALWMRVMGWTELLLGVAWGGLWLLTRLQAVPLQFGAAGVPERSPWLVQALALTGFGLLTLRAAAPVRRVAGAAAVSAGAVAPAVERLKDLYEAQVFVLLFVVAVAVASVL